MAICWLSIVPVYVPCELLSTWACQLCVYLCILSLIFDSLLEGTVLRFLEFVLWCFVFATAALLETCFCYLWAVSVSNRFYLSMSKCKLQTVGLFHVYNLNFNIDSSNFK